MSEERKVRAWLTIRGKQVPIFEDGAIRGPKVKSVKFNRKSIVSTKDTKSNV